MKSQYEVERMKYSDLDGSVVVPTYQRRLVWSEKQKESAGVYDDTVRVSVGIEDAEDLIEDFTQAIGGSL